MSKKTVTPRKLLAAFEEGCGKYSKPLLAKNHNAVISPPALLPGETLILQQDRVTCVNTLSQAATGSIHLTNYRIIFTGNYMQNKKFVHQMNEEYLATLGYRYQPRKHLFYKVSPNFRKLVEKSKSLKHYRKVKRLIDKSVPYMRKCASSDNLLEGHFGLINPIFNAELDDKKVDSKKVDENDAEVVISIPILSLYEIKKFPKQYLEDEKLLMLNPGIEIITTNYQAIKLCLGEDGSYDADELIKRLLRHSTVKSPSAVFAYMYARGVVVPKNCNMLKNQDSPNIYELEREILRLDITASSEWKTTAQLINDQYPERLIIPRTAMGPGKLKSWAQFHCNNCFPMVVWKDRQEGRILLRSARPITPRGFADTRCVVDEEIIASICASTQREDRRKLVIFTDSPSCSPATNGISVKEGETYYYPFCEIVHLDNIPDLVTTHQSGLKLQVALSKSDDSSYLSSIEESGWLNELEILLDYAMCIVASLMKGQLAVLMAIGSGTERVAQLSCLVQLLMDPYYRTLDGFQVLIQKEWLSVKYPFQKRSLMDLSSKEDLSPLFLQFLDCVWQLCQQYPTTFEFSEQLLELLATHAYSGRFGTFLSEVEDEDSSLVSFWLYVDVLRQNETGLYNFNYEKHKNKSVLQPNVSMVHLSVWTWFTQHKKEEPLFVASMFATMEMEKLQREYRDLLQQHDNLLQMISNSDAHSDMPAFNSLSLSPNSVLTDSSDCTSVVSLDESVNGTSLDRRWHSADDLLTYNWMNEASATVSRTGFFTTDKKMSAIGVLKRLRINTLSNGSTGTAGGFSLAEHLLQRGINCREVKGVRVCNATCSGYLVKQGGKYKNWLTRWFVADLQKKFVAYFEEPLSNEPKGWFDYLSIKSVNAKTYRKKGKFTFSGESFQFSVETHDRTYYLRAKSADVMHLWMACLSVPLSMVTS